MSRFPMWLRNLGDSTMVRVGGDVNATWLREQLQNKGVECTGAVEVHGTSYYTFRALRAHRIDDLKLRDIVSRFPQAELMHEPA
jgi:hypothetical protein